MDFKDRLKNKIKTNYDIVVIGAGPGGLAAAIRASNEGASVLLVERGNEVGGVLNQCIHSGFGLHEFKEELTGTEYAQRFYEELKKTQVDLRLNTMVIELTKDKDLTLVNEKGIFHVKARAIVLTMGCRERTAGAIGIKGKRPAGIMTAGAAQKFVNEEGYLVGKEVVIYGSGDIGLIMARRLTLEGAKVKMVLEIMPESSGLKRNIAQCLHDFSIPLKLSHAVVEVHGKDRVEGLTIAKVDKDRNIISGSESYISCDTLLLSVGLIPENELSQEAGIILDPKTSGPLVDNNMMTSVEGIFAAGNVLHVHDIVDFVSREGRLAGLNAALYARGDLNIGEGVKTIPGTGVSYVLPHKIIKNTKGKLNAFLRVKKTTRGARLEIVKNDEVIFTRKYPILIPSEMVYLDLDLDKLSPLEDLTFRLGPSDHE